MFTSIAKLRASSAQQNRVSSVANNLKKLNPSWQDGWFFPIVAIGLSNSADDISWVKGTPSVLLTSGPKAVRSVRSDKTATATEVNGAARKHYPEIGYGSRNKAELVTTALTAINEELRVLLANPDFDWTHGLTDEVATQPAQATTATTAEQAPAVSVETESKPAEVGPSDEEVILEKARAMFVKVFPDADNSTTTNRQGQTRFANDRVRGKFEGFFAALKALENGVFTFGDVFPRH